ncbi:D-lactate dehydrogenase [Novosphingobium sp.]|uniref:D-lactate dehydrogenase n=1 Tax=Novosphingobium sp. TaxID=1874826 RepID=UPI0031D79BC0
MTDSETQLLAALRQAVGPSHVLTSARATARYRKGYRTGSGPAIAVVRPGSLVELWRVARACVAADVSIIMQASNTGLTGGSTPDGADYPGGLVIISTTRLSALRVIREGEQVVGFPGSTLHHLEKLLKPYGREPHSVIGSSCIGASVIGGVCNNSGGSLVKRGPAYTEMALYAQLGEDGQLRLVNHLGIRLGDTPEEILTRLEKGDYRPTDVEYGELRASDNEYASRVRDVDADTPSRFNADKRRLYEASGCAGKLAVFAVRLDTFEKEGKEQVFYIGTNDTAVLTELRRHMLSQFENLPVAGEYMHRDIFDIAEVYGKDTFMMIDKLGTDQMPRFFAAKARVDALLGAGRSDRLMQWA